MTVGYDANDFNLFSEPLIRHESSYTIEVLDLDYNLLTSMSFTAFEKDIKKIYILKEYSKFFHGSVRLRISLKSEFKYRENIKLLENLKDRIIFI